MKIVADENIPFANEAFASLGEVRTLPGRNMQAADVSDCDLLLVRSITRVDEKLLADSRVQFVASATIGTDHVDLDYLQSRDIGFANAPGCNAESAAEYVISVLFHLARKKGFDPFALTAGIVGNGNVGSRVRKKLETLGIRYLVNDPPRQEASLDSINYVSLQTILHECDFITLHVPLTRDGEHPTHHLFDEAVLGELSDHCILFNAARGPVIDNKALSQLLKQRDDLTVFLDTWEGEPAVDPVLLHQVDFASPHIAGYSVEGKLRGTQMILEAACRHFQSSPQWNMLEHLPPRQTINLQDTQATLPWFELFDKHYAVEQDLQRMLAISGMSPSDARQDFDQQRKHYPQRFEFNHFEINGLHDSDLANTASGLLFCLK
jgi:erythronate-4-phosphate dehydrogenase